MSSNCDLHISYGIQIISIFFPYHDKWIFTRKMSLQYHQWWFLDVVTPPQHEEETHKNPSNLIKNVIGSVKLWFVFLSHAFFCVQKDEMNLFTSQQRDENHGRKKREKVSSCIFYFFVSENEKYKKIPKQTEEKHVEKACSGLINLSLYCQFAIFWCLSSTIYQFTRTFVVQSIEV